jgi:hypothetical protein
LPQGAAPPAVPSLKASRPSSFPPRHVPLWGRGAPGARRGSGILEVIARRQEDVNPQVGRVDEAAGAGNGTLVIDLAFRAHGKLIGRSIAPLPGCPSRLWTSGFRPLTPSFPSGAWERRPGSSASRVGHGPAPGTRREAELPPWRSQAELGNERTRGGKSTGALPLLSSERFCRGVGRPLMISTSS